MYHWITRASVIAMLGLTLTMHAHAQRGGAPEAAPAGKPVADPDRDADRPNLLRNGDFDEPAEDGAHPAHWQQTDNLVFHWTTDPDAPERGKVMRIDTDVYQRQAYAWWIDRFVHDAPLDDAPPKQQPTGNRYDTIGGLDGGHYWSDYIEIKPGGAYRVYVDAKGPGSKVFIRGYIEKEPLSFADEHPAVQQIFREARGEPTLDENGRPVRYRMRYRYTTWFPVGGSDEWETYTHDQPRHPNNREITENVRYIRIMLYPYWPAGEYWYDNVRVIEVEPDPAQARPDADEADLEERRIVR
ncbi:MAG: hypothetical protein WD534_07545 [Phycisphaeraceae bacterium]